MAYANKAYVLIGIFFISFQAFAQQLFLETNEPVNVAVMRDDGKQIVFAGSQYIYLMDVESFSITDSIKVVNKPNHAITSIRYVESNPNAVSIQLDQLTPFGLPRYKTDLLEYVEDSIFSYDLSKKELIKPILPGNSYISFAKDRSGYIFSYNNYFEYTDPQGMLARGSQPGQIVYYPDKIEVAASGIIKNIKVAPNGQELAVMYYDSLDQKGVSQFSLELRSLPNLEIKGRVPIKNKANEIIYSADGKYIVLKSSDRKYSFSPGEELALYSSGTLDSLTSIPSDLKIDHLIENGAIWRMKGNDIINYEYGSDEIKTRIWNNLTPFFSISRFFKINENELIIFGKDNPAMTTAGKSGFIKFSLKDEALFTEVQSVKSEEVLFDPALIKIENNAFSGNFMRSNAANELFISMENKTLQVWSLLKKKKLYELQFEEPITAFLSHDNESILIFEHIKGKRSDEFVLKSLNLKSGIIRSKNFPTDNLFFSPVSSLGPSNCECVNDSRNTNSWFCFDGLGSRIFKIDSESLSIEEILDLRNETYIRSNIFGFQLVPNSNLIQFGSYHDNDQNFTINLEELELFDIQLHHFDMDTDEIIKSKSVDAVRNYSAVDEAGYVYSQNGNIEKSSINNSSRELLTTIPKNYALEKVLQDSFKYAFVSSTGQVNDSTLLTTYDRKNKSSNSYNLSETSQLHFLERDGIGFKDGNQLFTYFTEFKDAVPWQKSKSVVNLNTDMSISDDGNFLFRHTWLVDLKTLEVKKELKGFEYSVLFNKSSKRLGISNNYYGEQQPYFQFKLTNLIDEETPLWLSEKFDVASSFESPNHIILSSNDHYAIAFNNNRYDIQNYFYLIDFKTSKVTKVECEQAIQYASFNKEATAFIIFSKKDFDYRDPGQSTLYELSDLDSPKKYPFKIERILPDDKLVWINFDNLHLGERVVDSINEGKPFYARSSLTIANYLDDKELLYAGDAEGNIFFWKEDNQSPVKQLNLGNSVINAVKRSGNKLFVLLSNSEVSIVDIDSLEHVLNIVFFEKDGKISMAYFTPEGHFKASKNDIRNFHFVKDAEPFPMLSYELFLNRPDLILEKLGYAGPKVIDIYRSAFAKRLKRNGFSESTDYLSIERPELTLTNQDDIKAIVNQEKLELKLQYSENVEILKVFINGVPAHDEIVDASGSQQLELVLNSGENNITIIGVNDQGIESDPISLRVDAMISRPSPKIHYIGIGVSKYADSTMNLRFADKDVRRMSSVLSDIFEGRIQIDTLNNELVSKDAIAQLKSKLLKTAIDDVVIISFSGHGLIDDNSEFYFAGHDMDFNDPAKNGISYYDIQNLLTDIPARRKLLLLDACHSGEIDSEEQLADKDIQNSNVTQHLPEGAKGSVGQSTKKNKKGLQSSFELMQSLFYDLDRGNGSFVISAAGGREYAYESADWGNGVFTYSFINGLYEAGRKNFNDDKLSISELKDYMYKSVRELTNGEQKPTARAENIEWDWILIEED